MRFLSPTSLVALTLCILSLQLCSIVVFATITAEGYTNPQTKGVAECIFNKNDSACSYGVGVGVLAFLACVVFLVLDAYFPQISNAKERKLIVMGDLIFSGERQVSLNALMLEKRNRTKKEEAQFNLDPDLFLCIVIFIVGQLCGRSCGSSASVSWPISGPKPKTMLLSPVMPPGLLWPSLSSLSSPG